MKDKAVIYAVKTGDTCHYIGKTVKENAGGEVTSSCITYQYVYPELREVFTLNEDSHVETLQVVDNNEWYDEKLNEVVKKHRDNHPLINAQWMLEGKRGYWEGKTRDPHTLSQLSRSKYIKVCQYNKDGVLVKVWDGAKEAAIEVFGDYQVVKFSGKTQLYNAIRAKEIRKKFKLGSYWFREKDLIRYFNCVPTRLNIDAIYQAERKLKREQRKKQVTEFTTRYTILQYDKHGEVIETFENSTECAYKLKIHMRTVQKICRGTQVNTNYLLAFGPKKRQSARQEYPRYNIRYKPDVVRHKRTRRTVEHYHGNLLIKTYDDIWDAADKLGITLNTVKKICQGFQYKKPKPDLRWGMKKTQKT